MIWAADANSLYVTVAQGGVGFSEIYQYFPATGTFANGGNPVSNTGLQLGQGFALSGDGATIFMGGASAQVGGGVWSSPLSFPAGATQVWVNQFAQNGWPIGVSSVAGAAR